MPSPSNTRDPDSIVPLDVDLPMTLDQAVQLKRLARAAYDMDAFDLQLTRGEARRRIETLKAKLKLQSEPPHTQ